MLRPTPIRPPRVRWRDSRAFTIVEVAVAASVLTLAIGTALITLGRGFNAMDTTRCLGYASQILQSELEKMRLEPWGNGTAAGNGTTGVTAYPAATTTIPIDDLFHTVGDVGSRMTMTRTVTDVHTGMLQVTLTVSWKSHDGHPISRSYTTYYGKEGLYDYFIL